MILMIFKW